jgi:hypothetical protein
MRALLITLFVSSLGFMSCSSQKSLQGNPPFTVERPTVQYWSGGREESGTGMRFEARWNPRDPSAVRVDSLFFRGRILKLEVRDTETGFLLVGSHATPGVSKPDYIMHADSTMEVGNQPPQPLPPLKNFPFDLNPDEAVLSYFVEGDAEKQYTKISGVREKQSRDYPGRQER